MLVPGSREKGLDVVADGHLELGIVEVVLNPFVKQVIDRTVEGFTKWDFVVEA